jgi:surface carbohydrate biosynthesis protein
LEAYIDAVAPVLVLSRTDNNPMLWQLKRRPSVAYTVALVQNGRRLDLESSLPAVLDPWGPHGVWRVDRAFTLGPTWASQLQRRFSSAVVAAGSIMANMFPSTRGITAAVVLVSTFRPEYPRRGLDLGESLYEGLGAYMRRHQLHLNVAGFAGPDGRGEEIAFLSARLPDGLWSLRSRESNWSSYETLLTAGTVIVDQSTLGYEALVLGKRVGFVGAMEWCRETHRFGKPLEFGEKGPFWTNEPSEAEIERILDYLLSVSDEQWEKDSGWIRDQLIVHDYGNTILKRYVEGVLAGKGDVLAEEAGGGRG